MFTKTIVRFQASVELKKAFLQGVLSEYSKSIENGTSTDSMVCKREETFHKLDQVEYKDALFFREFNVILE